MTNAEPNPETIAEAKAQLALAGALCGEGRLADAAAACRRALAIRPDYAAACSNLGVIAAGLGRLEEAAAALRRALRLDPSQPDIRLNLGVILNRLVGERSGRALFGGGGRGLGAVRRQYESLPFPPRDPEAERYALKVSNPDILAKINQYCFAGGRDFSRPFRVLVAGCGTGDSVVWLAHQLKDMPADIVALDLSEASLEVARARARVRGLESIRWVQGSLLDIARSGLGEFDYITCLGVLHHLPDPVAGLRALESVLAEGGGMAIMLYGAVGRSHIYSAQRLLRSLTKGLDDPGETLSFARKIVANLGPTNDFRQREGVEGIRNVYLSDDTNFWDTLLHAEDRAYTVSQLRDYLASAGLHAQGFISYSGNAATTALQYDLDFLLNDPSHAERLGTLSRAEREDAAELLDGSLALHTVYATREPLSALDPASPDAILSPMSETGRKILGHLAAGEGGITVVLRNGSSFDFEPKEISRRFFAEIDGHRSNSAIAAALGMDPAAAAFDPVRAALRVPAALHWVTARTAQGTFLPPLPDRATLSFPWIHCEPSLLAL